jgi:hypothetical protein
VVQGPADANVGERLLLGVEGDPPDVGARLPVVREAGVLLELVDVIRGHVHDEIHTA